MNSRTIVLIGFTAILTFMSSVVFAADARFCDQYARKSVQQQVANVAHQCGQTGLRWSPLYAGQREWCLTVRQPIAENETQARETALTRCGTTSGPVNWRSLPGTPTAWDALFAQEVMAMKKDDVVSIEVMHRHGVDINHDEGFNNGTILLHAIREQAEKVARYLVEQGVNPNRTTNGGWNPLINMFTKWDPVQKKYISTEAKLSLLQFLLNNGADPNSFGELNSGSLPLDEAVKRNQLQAAAVLLSAGADPNKHDFGIESLLMRTIMKRNHQAVVLLVNRGANVNMGSSGKACHETEAHNIMPLDKAMSAGVAETIRFLRNRGARTNAQCLAD